MDFNHYINSYNYSWLIDFIKENGIRKNYDKNDFFSQINSICHEIGFVEDGAFRYTSFSTDGTPHVVGYAFKNTFVCDYASFSLQKPSEVEIDAMTECVVYCIDYNTVNKNALSNHEFTLKAKHITELLYADVYKRYINNHILTAKERYIDLLKRCPNLFSLVTLKEIASFLNIRPETLSRIRKKINEE
ncbi:MAG: Crp/Fnr family transcriptional regulator [Petrimonas sp.]|jgi:CRP-like cAMP-binding protein|nr:MAG: Cyclic nucleotide-binding domain protein [Bacteroidetes bacterium ADurb.BinA174]